MSLMKNEYLRLRFTNPLTNAVDSVTIKKSDLKSLKESGRGDGLMIISFFHTQEESNYVVNLYLDSDYNVRSVLTSNFMLKTPEGKLFGSKVAEIPFPCE